MQSRGEERGSSGALGDVGGVEGRGGSVRSQLAAAEPLEAVAESRELGGQRASRVGGGGSEQ